MSAPGFLIVGAGPCGIGAALTLQNEFQKQPFILAEALPTGGGNAASEVTPEGFTFDYGGHVLFVHEKYAEFDRLRRNLDQEWNASCPIRGVFMHDRLIPTPVQRNLHRLPWSVAIPILVDLLRDRVGRKLTNRKSVILASDEESLADYLRESYGQEMTRRVMQPLNQKMWTLHPADMTSVWVRQRSGSQLTNLPQVKLRRVLMHALLGTDDPSWTKATRVIYPATGGIGSIWQKLLDRVRPEHLWFGKKIVAIKTIEKIAIFEDGSQLPYSTLISTMPLHMLLELCIDQPAFPKLSAGLRWSSALLFGFGIEGALPRAYTGVHSFQSPGHDVPFWRVTIPSNFSPGNVPRAGTQYSIMCEVSCKPSDRLEINQNLRRAVRQGLSKIGLLADGAQIISTFEKLLPYGYPLPFLGRDELLKTIHRQLEPLQIMSRGRFGGWRYEVSNQDHAYMQGAEVVRYLMTGAPEQTYTNPALIN